MNSVKYQDILNKDLAVYTGKLELGCRQVFQLYKT